MIALRQLICKLQQLWNKAHVPFCLSSCEGKTSDTGQPVAQSHRESHLEN